MAKRHNKNRIKPLVAAVSCVCLSISQGVLARGSDSPVEFLGGSVTLDGIYKAYDGQNPTAGKDKTQTDGGLSTFLNFGFTGLGFAGDFSLNAMPKSSDSDFKYKYGDRLNDGSGGKKVEIYNFSATHIGEKGDINLFYHVPRYHWGYEGDHFGLMYETTNMADQDIWNEKAPAGAEFVGRGELDGLKVVAGKQIYWGAEPMVMAKYQFGEKDQYSILASREVGDKRKAAKLSAQGEFELGDSTEARLGVLYSGNQFKNDAYDYLDKGVIYSDEVESKDMLAVRGRLTHDLSGGVQPYVALDYAGLVADAGEHQELWDTNMPYSSKGNKAQVELGAQLTRGNFLLVPRLMARENLIDANPNITNGVGFGPRSGINGDSDPFTVGNNRAVRAAELYLTYDPTPGTYFYEWDNYLKEDAPVAFNVGLTHINFKGRSDASTFFTEDGTAFNDFGRAPEVVNMLSSRVMLNPTDDIRVRLEIDGGLQQPLIGDTATGAGKEVNKFWSLEGAVVHNSQNVYSFKYAKDAFGEYDFQREFGIRYPKQIELGYERLLDTSASPSKYGVKAFYRTLDENSTEYLNGANDSMVEVKAYFTYSF